MWLVIKESVILLYFIVSAYCIIFRQLKRNKVVLGVDTRGQQETMFAWYGQAQCTGPSVCDRHCPLRTGECTLIVKCCFITCMFSIIFKVGRGSFHPLAICASATWCLLVFSAQAQCCQLGSSTCWSCQWLELLWRLIDQWTLRH